MKLDIDLREQATADNLPDEPEDKMLAALSEIRGSNVDHGTANALCRGNDNIVVLGDLEGIQRFPRLRFIQDTGINGVGHRVVDKFREDQTVFAFVEELHSVGGDRIDVADIGIVFDDLGGV